MLRLIRVQWFCVLIVLTTVMSPLAAEGLTGVWKTIDDETGEAKSLIEIKKMGDEYQGVIKELLNPSEPNPVYNLCTDNRKDQPIIGMMIMSGITGSDDSYTPGEILDPQNGKLYSVNVKLIEEGQKLEVRGYIGFSLLGRTQTWQRNE